MRDRFSGKSSTPTGEVPGPTRRMILQSLARADVLYLAFPRLQRALVVDLRRDAHQPPAVFLMDLYTTAAREVAAIEERRPGFAAIERFASVTWGGSTRAFAEQGVLPAILNRLPTESVDAAMVVFEELRDAELTPERRTTRARTPGQAGGGAGTG